MHRVVFAAFVAFALLSVASAQNIPAGPGSVGINASGTTTGDYSNINGTHKPDVLLDIPLIKVDLISLVVEELKAKVSLNASIARGLVTVTAGVDASISKVSLTIKDVQAQAHLTVRLDNVREIVDRTMTLLENHPDLLANTLAGITSGLAGLETLVTSLPNLLSALVSTAGAVVTQIDSLGNIVQSGINTSGKCVRRTVVGNVAQHMVPVSITPVQGSSGQNIQQYISSNGAIVEVTRNAQGAAIAHKVIARPSVQRVEPHEMPELVSVDSTLMQSAPPTVNNPNTYAPNVPLPQAGKIPSRP